MDLKNTILILLVLLLHSCINENKTSIDYELEISLKVEEFKAIGKVNSNPLIVLNGLPYAYDTLKKERILKTFNDTIKSISALPIETREMLYGERGNNGVIIVSTKRYLEKK